MVFTGGVIKLGRTVNLDDTHVLVQALAAAAPRLAELGVGGLFHTRYGLIETYVIFTLPNGKQGELEQGRHCIISLGYNADDFITLLHCAL